MGLGETAIEVEMDSNLNVFLSITILVYTFQSVAVSLP